MIRQTRASSFAESCANLAVGLVVSWLLTYWVLPLWGYAPSVGQATEIALVFTLASVARSYGIRRAFNARGAVG